MNNLVNRYQALELKLEYKFNNINLLSLALTHSSFIKNSKLINQKPNLYNERLEFLGDKILGFVVTEYIYDNFTDKKEGYLSKLVSYVTSSKILYEVGCKLDLMSIIQYQKDSNDNNFSLLSDAVEAIFASIYLDSNKNINIIKKIIVSLLKSYILSYEEGVVYKEFNPKSYVQEWAQKKGLPIPTYNQIDKIGTEHNPVFIVSLYVEGFDTIEGKSKNIKDAQKDAANNFIKINNLKK